MMYNSIMKELKPKNKKLTMKIKDKLDKFQEWLEKCPIEYDEHLQTSDDDITSINFHYKNIWNRNLIKEDK